jgi:tight adherence protein B
VDILIGIGIFLSVVLLINGTYYALRSIRKPEARKVRKRLLSLSSGSSKEEPIDIMRGTAVSEVPWLNRLLLKLRWTEKMKRLLEQAGSERPLGFFVLLSVLLAAVGFLIFSRVDPSYVVSVWMAIIFALMPFFYIYWKKRRRMQKFERQLPEALDLIARSLKAGHAFSGGLKMVVDEFSDPISSEFDEALNEINFGFGINDALKNMLNRVDCPDLRFFVISVVIQRETGGNLAEILTSIAHLIRERFRLQGHVRTLAAEGKFSAYILTGIPFFVTALLMLLSPGYVETLMDDPIGRMMIIIGMFMMAVGAVIMKKIITIKV